MVGSRLWCLAKGAQLDKAKPRPSLLGEQHSSTCCATYHGKGATGTAGTLIAGPQGIKGATVLHFFSISWEVCMEWKGEYICLHPRPISIYCSIVGRIRELSRKYTEEIPNAKIRWNILTEEGKDPFWHTCLNQTSWWLKHWFRCNLTLVRSDWKSSYKRQFLSPLGAACLQTRIRGQKRTSGCCWMEVPGSPMLACCAYPWESIEQVQDSNLQCKCVLTTS